MKGSSSWHVDNILQLLRMVCGSAVHTYAILHVAVQGRAVGCTRHWLENRHLRFLVEQPERALVDSRIHAMLKVRNTTPAYLALELPRQRPSCPPSPP